MAAASRGSRQSSSAAAAAAASSAASGTGQRLLARIPNILSRTPRPLWYIFGFLTSSYLLTTYLIGKVSDLHSRITAESNTKEGLKRGFKQNQEDVGFTIMALLPMLSKGMDGVFDVEGTTGELKAIGAAAAAAAAAAASESESASAMPAIPPVEAAEAAVVPGDTDATPTLNGHALSAGSEKAEAPIVNGTHADAGANSTESEAANETDQGAEVPMQDASAQAQSKAVTAEAVTRAEAPAEQVNDERKGDEKDLPETSSQPVNGADETAAAKDGERQNGVDAAKEAAQLEQERLAKEEEAQRAAKEAEEQRLKAEAERLAREEALAVERAEAAARAAEAASVDRKRKAVLWNDLKVMSVSRYLTTVYAVNLLSMMTNLQLSLLGRYSYLRSLDGAAAADAEPDVRSPAPKDPLEDAWADAKATTSTSTPSPRSSKDTASKLTQEIEEQYLTFSWYFLHVGYKQLAERVQSKVEETLTSVPLKAQLSHADLLHLLRRIRRKVEYEYEYAEEADGDGHPAPAPAFMGAESLMAGLRSPPPPVSEDPLSQSMSSIGSRRSTRRRRRRFNMLQAYLLPRTPEGDMQVLASAGHRPATTSTSLDTALQSLLDETRDLLDSRDASEVIRECLTASFDTSFTSLGLAFGLDTEELDHITGADPTPSSTTTTTRRIREVRTAEEEAEIRLHPQVHGQRLKLASILPVLTREANLVTHAMPNALVDAIASVQDLRAFAAIVYSSWTSGGA